MRLRRKTLACVVLSIAGLVGAALWVADGLVMHGFERVERDELSQKVEDVRGVVRRCVEEYSASFSDWSQWDDMAQFLGDGNRPFLDSNVNLSTLADNIQADFLLVVREDGAHMLATEVDEARDALVPASERIVARVRADGLLRAGASYGGFLAFNDATYLVSSRPILRSDGKPGAVRGRLITGELLGPAWVERLKGFTFLDLAFTRTADTPLEEPELAAREALAEGTRTFVGEPQPTSLSGYTLLPDICGKPALVLRVTRGREIREHGLAIVRSMMLTLAAGGVAVALFALWLVRRGLIRPLELLLAGTHKLQRGEHSHVVMHTDDEFQELARALNALSDMLAEGGLPREGPAAPLQAPRAPVDAD